MKEKIAVITTLTVIVIVCAAASSKKADPLYTNLKVLPKSISSRDLQGLMVDDFQDGLGVTCDFCHATAKDGHGLNFASDQKPEKQIAREMMRMTMGINKKYFKVKHPSLGSTVMVVNCETCHRGVPFPEGANYGEK